jgi:hypothetical protein
MYDTAIKSIRNSRGEGEVEISSKWYYFAFPQSQSDIILKRK